MSHNYVYSTLTSGMTYTLWTKGENDLPVAEMTVVIKGGANIADKHLVTPHGVVTEVTDHELAMLEQNELFQLHKKNGFIIVSTSKLDPEVPAADMEQRDDSAPLRPQDFKDEEGEVKPRSDTPQTQIADKMAGNSQKD